MATVPLPPTATRAAASSYRIPFNRPAVSPSAAACVTDVLRSDTLAGIGPFGHQCETLLEQLTGASRALLTPSCTHALEMSALLLNPVPGDEVIVPTFSFVSTANAFAMYGMKPVFIDCDPGTLNLDATLLPGLVTPRTRAVVAMHYAGVACELDAIAAFSRQHGLVTIEDNAHGLLARYRGRLLGTFGSLATHSFDETKNITCGQGGALLVNDPALAERAEVLRQRGTNRSSFFRGEVDKYTWIDAGSNWVLSELHAALLWGHLGERTAIQEIRHRIWSRYDVELRSWARVNDARQPVVSGDAEHPAHLYYLILPTADARSRLIAHLGARGIQAVFHYSPLHLSQMGRRFGAADGDCPVAERLSARLLRLPLYDSLSDDEQSDVIEAVTAFTV